MMRSEMVYADYDLVTMSREELDELQDEIKETIDEYHKTDGKIEAVVKNLTQKEVEVYLKEHEKNVDVSWPWFDYKYTNDWGYYTLTTSVEYKDEENKKIKLEVYAESYPLDEELEFSYSYKDVEKSYTIYYLEIGDNVVINRKEELPEQLLALFSSELTAINIPTPEPIATNTPTPEPTATNTPTPEPTATNTPTPEPTATNTPTPTPVVETTSVVLEKGSKGDEVKEIQERLIDLGYLSGAADGIFGNQTEEAIKAFQERNNLEVTGIATSAIVNKILSSNVVKAESTEKTTSKQKASAAEATSEQEIKVWLSATGSKYHSKNNCGRMNPSTARQVSKSTAIQSGYDACSKCW